MRCIFYHVEPYIQEIQEAVHSYSIRKGIEIEYIIAEEEIEIQGALKEECVLFYLLADSIGLPETKVPQAKMIALCQSYEEGIRALEEGTDYALQIPINREKMTRCCEYLYRRYINQEV